MTSNPRYWRFAVSPDGCQFAIWQPGNEPWFIPVANLPGHFVGSFDSEMEGWTHFAPTRSPETLDQLVRDVVDDEIAPMLATQLARVLQPIIAAARAEARAEPADG